MIPHGNAYPSRAFTLCRSYCVSERKKPLAHQSQTVTAHHYENFPSHYLRPENTPTGKEFTKGYRDRGIVLRLQQRFGGPSKG